MSRSCSGASLNFVRLIGGMRRGAFRRALVYFSVKNATTKKCNHEDAKKRRTSGTRKHSLRAFVPSWLRLVKSSAVRARESESWSVATVNSDKGRARLAEVPVQQRGGIGAEPAVDDARVHRPEIGFVVHVAGVVLERRVLGVRVEIRRRAEQPAADASAHHQHGRRRAVIGALAAVFADAAPELREAQDQRVLEESLVLEIVVEREQAVVERSHQVVVRAVG